MMNSLKRILKKNLDRPCLSDLKVPSRTVFVCRQPVLVTFQLSLWFFFLSIIIIILITLPVLHYETNINIFFFDSSYNNLIPEDIFSKETETKLRESSKLPLWVIQNDSGEVEGSPIWDPVYDYEKNQGETLLYGEQFKNKPENLIFPNNIRKRPNYIYRNIEPSSTHTIAPLWFCKSYTYLMTSWFPGSDDPTVYFEKNYFLKLLKDLKIVEDLGYLWYYLDFLNYTLISSRDYSYQGQSFPDNNFFIHERGSGYSYFDKFLGFFGWNHVSYRSDLNFSYYDKSFKSYCKLDVPYSLYDDLTSYKMSHFVLEFTFRNINFWKQRLLWEVQYRPNDPKIHWLKVWHFLEIFSDRLRPYHSGRVIYQQCDSLGPVITVTELDKSLLNHKVDKHSPNIFFDYDVISAVDRYKKIMVFDQSCITPSPSFEHSIDRLTLKSSPNVFELISLGSRFHQYACNTPRLYNPHYDTLIRLFSLDGDLKSTICSFPKKLQLFESNIEHRKKVKDFFTFDYVNIPNVFDLSYFRLSNRESFLYKHTFIQIRIRRSPYTFSFLPHFYHNMVNRSSTFSKLFAPDSPTWTGGLPAYNKNNPSRTLINVLKASFPFDFKNPYTQELAWCPSSCSNFHKRQEDPFFFCPKHHMSFWHIFQFFYDSCFSFDFFKKKKSLRFPYKYNSSDFDFIRSQLDGYLTSIHCVPDETFSGLDLTRYMDGKNRDQVDSLPRIPLPLESYCFDNRNFWNRLDMMQRRFQLTFTRDNPKLIIACQNLVRDVLIARRNLSPLDPDFELKKQGFKAFVNDLFIRECLWLYDFRLRDFAFGLNPYFCTQSKYHSQYPGRPPEWYWYREEEGYEYVPRNEFSIESAREYRRHLFPEKLCDWESDPHTINAIYSNRSSSRYLKTRYFFDYAKREINPKTGRFRPLKKLPTIIRPAQLYSHDFHSVISSRHCDNRIIDCRNTLELYHNLPLVEKKEFSNTIIHSFLRSPQVYMWIMHGESFKSLERDYCYSVISEAYKLNDYIKSKEPSIFLAPFPMISPSFGRDTSYAQADTREVWEEYHDLFINSSKYPTEIYPDKVIDLPCSCQLSIKCFNPKCIICHHKLIKNLYFHSLSCSICEGNKVSDNYYLEIHKDSSLLSLKDKSNQKKQTKFTRLN